MDAIYKFVHSVDPTKCKPKIKEKFAKLTLSSNKKKQEDAAERQSQILEEARLSNVSRKLYNELLTDDESDNEEETQKPVENLLMRTDTSSSNAAPRTSMDTTHCSEVEKDGEKSLEMEPLQVSGGVENTEIDDAIERLSSRVSSLAMGPPAREVSQIISIETQKMSGAQRFSDMLMGRPKQEPEPEVSICISSSDESESPITISDSSEGEQDYETHVSCEVTKNPPQRSDGGKDERMAAFLRDVRRNYGLPVDSPDRDYESKQKRLATADTEPMTMDSDSRSVGTAARIASADTESMTPEPEIPVKEPSTSENTSGKRLALNDTEDMTKASETMLSSPGYQPVMKVGTDMLDDSLNRSKDSIPEDSLTIAETSEEEQDNVEKSESPRPQTGSALKRSDSFSQRMSKESKESSESSGQDMQFQINISAKINIKIQVSQQLEESSSSSSANSTGASQPNEDSSPEKTHNSAHKPMSQSRAIEEVPHSPPERDVSQKTPETEQKSPDDFMDKAQRLLNELYGNTWKTPDVMRSLKKTTAPRRRRAILPAPKQIEPEPKDVSPPRVEVLVPQPKEPEIEPRDESALDDFSIFRRNIPQDLDSTRLPMTPSIFKAPLGFDSTSKARRKKPNSTTKTPQAEVTKTKSGREVRWRALVDPDTESEGENASCDSDKSWSQTENDEEIENKKPTSPKRGKRQTKLTNSKKGDDELVYLDLSKGEVEVQHNVSASPPANHDEKFSSRLEEILKTCRIENKPKIPRTPGGSTKRKLFTVNLNDDEESLAVPFDSPKSLLRNEDEEVVSLTGALLPAKFEPFNKYLESVKTGKPIFKIQTPKTKQQPTDGRSETIKTPSSKQQAAEDDSLSVPRTPKSSTKQLRVVDDLCATPKDKYGFLKSLDLCVGKSRCHPDALYYRENFRLKRDELATKLYEIYNKKCFNMDVEVPLKWNKKLTNTAGRCMTKKRLGERTCAIELSEKVLTSADRLRCTLIHELCHAATWIFNGEGGHGATWKAWARKANQVFPELPKIGVCHQYDIEYKYTYKCTLCAAKSHAHSKSKKVENIRCSYCHGPIEVFLNKKDKEGNTIATPVREPTGFAKFVKDKYKEYKRPDLKHADIMKLLSNEFASMKVGGKS